jgi:hypothetical protein
VLARCREHYGTADPAPGTSTNPDCKGGVGRRKDPSLTVGVSGRVQQRERDITKWDIFYYVYGLLHHLIGHVVRVSVETVRIVKGLPVEFA